MPTSYLNKEKVGERALLLPEYRDRRNGLEARLAYNPWGGATVAGDLVIVTGSSIGYYYKELKGAKGDLTALDLKTGKAKWRKEMPTGGIVGCAAASDGLAVCTATDGKVRAYKLADGERAWLYDAKTPFFAPPAVAGGVVYVADLAGVVHALDLKTGAREVDAEPRRRRPVRPAWFTAASPSTAASSSSRPATSKGPYAGKETVVVCIGSK